MYLENIIGQEEAKLFLTNMYKSRCISPTLFFLGPAGYGGLPLSIAYARQLLFNEKDPSNYLKLDTLQHPDLHFIFPTAPNVLSSDLFYKWREFIKNNSYGNLFQWLEYIKIGNKTGKIGIEETQKIIKKLQMKSYEGGYKVLIMWMPERLNVVAANNLLKILEYPPEKTIMLFVGEEERGLLPPILSRLQLLRLKPIPVKEIQKILQKKYNLIEKKAIVIAQGAEGDLGRTLQLIQCTEENDFGEVFRQWIRNIFLFIKKTKALKTLIEWSEVLHNWGKERQIQFLDYCLYIFRIALFTHYNVKKLTFNPLQWKKVDWEYFSTYIQWENMKGILKEINKASREIWKNAHANLVFLDLSIQIAKYLH
ncbi:DNA polymerase III subunit [Candidatus Walczuchella monophlebidarum]|uniref:DNA polymerase III subunit delta n=1 Tax=Candidatus Walczuchella monophlebidarum TaxID=1415657 RepID=A0A068DQM0_9FLAO|nr:hypothetical protein [Candidatus Walczuchella monophlebidarum]AID37552.1 DNA polymerase III subunit delta' [Candidatus Walczuchella monophlebidarum]